MTGHFEGFELGAIDWVGPRGEIGVDTVPGGKYAITFSNGDGAAYGVGTVEEIVEFGRQVRIAVNQIEESAAGPLTHVDFIYDVEDQMYLCPRCEEGVEPGDFTALVYLIQAIDAHAASHRPEHERE